MPGGQATIKEYIAACEQHDSEHKQKRTRLHWGNGRSWTQGARSWYERPGTEK